MKITIISACWQVKNLKKLIKSVDAQTFTEWEHILINDNNPGVRKEFKKYCDGKKRHWIDLGIRTYWSGCYARNIGIMASFVYHHQSRRQNWDEHWIILHDEDNIWYPNHLETLVDMHKKVPSATLLGTDFEIRSTKDPNYKKIQTCKIEHQKCDLGGFLYKKELFDKYGYFNARPERRYKFDIELLEKIAKGEGEDKIYIKHIPTWIFYSRNK